LLEALEVRRLLMADPLVSAESFSLGLTDYSNASTEAEPEFRVAMDVLEVVNAAYANRSLEDYQSTDLLGENDGGIADPNQILLALRGSFSNPSWDDDVLNVSGSFDSDGFDFASLGVSDNFQSGNDSLSASFPSSIGQGEPDEPSDEEEYANAVAGALSAHGQSTQAANEQYASDIDAANASLQAAKNAAEAAHQAALASFTGDVTTLDIKSIDLNVGNPLAHVSLPDDSSLPRSPVPTPSYTGPEFNFNADSTYQSDRIVAEAKLDSTISAAKQKRQDEDRQSREKYEKALRDRQDLDNAQRGTINEDYNVDINDNEPGGVPITDIDAAAQTYNDGMQAAYNTFNDTITAQSSTRNNALIAAGETLASVSVLSSDL
jgi:hypothetical protein